MTGHNHHMSRKEVLESAALFGKNMAEDVRRGNKHNIGLTERDWNDFMNSINPDYHVEASEAYLKSYTETRRAQEAPREKALDHKTLKERADERNSAEAFYEEGGR